jgi:tetratricopeptide (TPR) repeat protein
MSSDILQTDFTDETRSDRAFELVTDALLNIDCYQESEDPKFLARAEKRLQAALEKDPKYFKARYFQAMVSYLSGKAGDAIEQFNGLLSAPDPALSEEIKYNLAAAYSQVGRSTQAIPLFKQVIKATRDDPELNLLARAGLLLARAERWRARPSDRMGRGLRLIRAQGEAIRKRLRTNFLMRWLRSEKSIDKRTTQEVESLVDKALGEERMPRDDWHEFFIRRKRFILIMVLVIGALSIITFIFASIVSYYLYRGFHYR